MVEEFSDLSILSTWVEGLDKGVDAHPLDLEPNEIPNDWGW